MSDLNKYNNYTDFEEISNSSAPPIAMQSAFGILMRKVYTWMALALIVTGLTAYYVAGNVKLLTMMMGGGFWVCAIAEVILVIAISAGINKLSFMTSGLMFIAYSILNGLTMSFIFVAYTHSSIAQTFFITAGTFAAMGLFGYFTKKDLSKMGRILFMALIGLIIASVVNIFMNNSTIYWITSYAGVIIFVGLTAWDVQKIKQMFLQYGYDVNEQTQKLALQGSLMLYLDFINLFIYLLRIFGNRND